MLQQIRNKTSEQLVRDEIEIWRTGKFFPAAIMFALFVAFTVYLFAADEVSVGIALFLITGSLVSGFAAAIFEGKQHSREYDYRQIFGAQDNND